MKNLTYGEYYKFLQHYYGEDTTVKMYLSTYQYCLSEHYNQKPYPGQAGVIRVFFKMWRDGCVGQLKCMLLSDCKYIIYDAILDSDRITLKSLTKGEDCTKQMERWLENGKQASKFDINKVGACLLELNETISQNNSLIKELIESNARLEKKQAELARQIQQLKREKAERNQDIDTDVHKC